MHIVSCCLVCLLGLALGGTASAQVYESRDAQGNPVFSDKPSAGAEEVKVPPTNSADPVADAPERPEQATTPRPGTGAAAPGRRANDKGDDDDEPYFYYGGAGVDEEEARERREEARERREEGSGRPDGERPPRAETLPAAPRRAAGGARR